MDVWDIVLLVVVTYIALTSLVRLMLGRRDALLKDLQRQLEERPK